MQRYRVDIPSCNDFIKQWNPWIYSKVSKLFVRNKDRVEEATQRVIKRLVEKDFIGRWFMNPSHGLDQELVDRTQAERILGGAPIMFIGALSPIADGPSRSSKDSLWRVSDLLKYAKFDYDRYYYSIQNHKIDSDRVLELIGYPPKSYESLASLYRQGRLKPAEFTEHECVGDGCSECLKGKKSLKRRGISLAHRWDNPSVESKVKNLRWNDSQLDQFLRNWRRKNAVSTVPKYIMREADLVPPKKCRKCKSLLVIKDLEFYGPTATCEKCGNQHPLVKGIHAGLLQFVLYIIKNDVINYFKLLDKIDGVSKNSMTGVSPDIDNLGSVGWESSGDSEDDTQCVIIDPGAMYQFTKVDMRRDAKRITDSAELDGSELGVIEAIHTLNMTVKEYAEQSGMKVKIVHKLYNNTIKKIRGESIPKKKIDSVVSSVCNEHGCSYDDIFSAVCVGKPVVARTQLFHGLYDAGMSIRDMAVYFQYPVDRVNAAVHRHHIYNT